MFRFLARGATGPDEAAAPPTPRGRRPAGRRAAMIAAACLTLGVGVIAAGPASASPAQVVTVHGPGGVEHTVTVSPAAAAAAATPDAGGLAAIVCGGTKYGSGWSTYPAGGYVGQGCGAGIDFIETPTNGYSVYNFGVSAGGSYVFKAWIPDYYSDGNMDYSLYYCGAEVADSTVNQANWDSPAQGFLTLFGGTFSGGAGCAVQIIAWTGQATAGLYMGLDAIES